MNNPPVSLRLPPSFTQGGLFLQKPPLCKIFARNFASPKPPLCKGRWLSEAKSEGLLNKPLKYKF